MAWQCESDKFFFHLAKTDIFFAKSKVHFSPKKLTAARIFSLLRTGEMLWKVAPRFSSCAGWRWQLFGQQSATWESKYLRIIHLDNDKNDLFVDLQEMRRRYVALTPAPNHIFFYLSMSPKHRIQVMKQFLSQKSRHNWQNCICRIPENCKIYEIRCIGETNVGSYLFAPLIFKTLFAKAGMSWVNKTTRIPTEFVQALMKHGKTQKRGRPRRDKLRWEESNPIVNGSETLFLVQITRTLERRNRRVSARVAGVERGCC